MTTHTVSNVKKCFRDAYGELNENPRRRGIPTCPWPGRFHDPDHISTRQYARLVKKWVASIGLEPSSYGTHTMRRTNVAQIYKKTGNLRAVQLLLGHTKMDSTVRYLGVDLEDALAISEGAEIYIQNRAGCGAFG